MGPVEALARELARRDGLQPDRDVAEVMPRDDTTNLMFQGAATGRKFWLVRASFRPAWQHYEGEARALMVTLSENVSDDMAAASKSKKEDLSAALLAASRGAP